MPKLHAEPRRPSPTREATPTSAPQDSRPAWLQSFTDDGPIDVTVCIANWNCRDYLRACLESLQDKPQGVRLETVVVDNGSEDGAADMVARDFPEVRLIRNDDNLGFARASNQAAEVARGKYVFFLNNDTLVPAGTIRRLMNFAEQNPDVGMVGPRLRGGDGKLQISYRERPTVPALMHRTALFRWTGLFRSAYRKYRREHFHSDVDRPVEILMGAAVLVRRELFEETGKWDEGFRFGGEDIDLSERIGREHPLVYLASVEITHFGRISSRRNIEFAAPNVAIGYVRYFRKTGASRAMLSAYKLAVTLDAPLQLIAKSGQYMWRKLTGRGDKAEKSRLALKGAWRFYRRELGRFWAA